jgi:hypothetical protein
MGAIQSGHGYYGKSYWLKVHTQQRPEFDLPPTDNWSMWHTGKRLATWSGKLALDLIHSSPSKKFWKKKQRITDEQDEPAWDTLYQAFESAPATRKLWISKWLTGWLPTRKKLKRWKIQTTDACPGCGEPEINRQHPMRCATVDATQQWNATFRKCDEWMLKNHTQSELHTSILEGLDCGENNNHTLSPLPTGPVLNKHNKIKVPWDGTDSSTDS